MVGRCHRILRKDDRGHSSLTALALILSASLLFMAFALPLRQNLIRYESSLKRLDALSLANRITGEIIKALKEDPTPEAHGPTDPVWDLIPVLNGKSTHVTLRDISSRLNPNWMRFKLFQETRLAGLIQTGKSPYDLEDRRRTMGFVTDLALWEDCFGTDNLTRYFTLHSWANINVTREEALEELYRLRCGENGAIGFRFRVQKALGEGKLWKGEELREVMGLGADRLYPAVNTLPAMNVHFMEPLLLECLLAYPYRERPLDNHSAKARLILEIRKNRELDRAELIGLIDPGKEQMRVLEYLGCRTWFWEVTIETGDYRILRHIAYDGEQWRIL